MIDSHSRSFFKSISWRIWATATTMSISYFVTGNISFAIAIGSIEFFAKIILYYIHERLWARFFRFGFKQQ